MNGQHRIRTIYWKELVDILRDRRTLIAMIVVPIVLYPLLMLGSVQAVIGQRDVVGREKLFLGVVGQAQKTLLSRAIDEDAAVLNRQRSEFPPDSAEALSVPTPLRPCEILVYESEEAVRRDVARRLINVGVIFENARESIQYDEQEHVRILADLEEVRSGSAARRVSGMFDRRAVSLLDLRLKRQNLPAAFMEPYVVSTTNLAAPQSILGQILPLILVLMTITGAIYPAIDLTAGERERGTLESLMVCPVPVIDLIVGKFLVVTTVAIMGAALNLASVSATVYLGGFKEAIATTADGIPYAKMLLILLCLIPFAILMSAIMIAVCSYARTFKEAQNYVTPVILAVLIPGGIAAMPASRLDGVMLVMPVGNMVLLARDMLIGAVVPLSHMVMVLASTALYAGAAVAIAANVFGKESVVFADAASLKATLSRRFVKPSRLPTVSVVLLVIALLFPAWLYVQTSLQTGQGMVESGDATGLLRYTALLMPFAFVLLPGLLLVYWKINLRESFVWRLPRGALLIAAMLIGVSAWVPARELQTLQAEIIGGTSTNWVDLDGFMNTLSSMSIVEMLLLLAVVPAVCEELLFRGFLLSGLRTSFPKWTALILAGAIFGVFHFFMFKFVVTALLGVLLGYICWQSRSIWPGVIAHFLHNAVSTLTAVHEEQAEHWLGIPPGWSSQHMPPHVIVTGLAVFAIGLLLCAWLGDERRPLRRPASRSDASSWSIRRSVSIRASATTPKVPFSRSTTCWRACRCLVILTTMVTLTSRTTRSCSRALAVRAFRMRGHAQLRMWMPTAMWSSRMLPFSGAFALGLAGNRPSIGR